MCEGSASFAVDRDRVEGACGGREVLPVGLLTRPRSDRGRSCERVNAQNALGFLGNGRMHYSNFYCSHLTSTGQREFGSPAKLHLRNLPGW